MDLRHLTPEQRLALGLAASPGDLELLVPPEGQTAQGAGFISTVVLAAQLLQGALDVAPLPSKVAASVGIDVSSIAGHSALVLQTPDGSALEARWQSGSSDPLAPLGVDGVVALLNDGDVLVARTSAGVFVVTSAEGRLTVEANPVAQIERLTQLRAPADWLTVSMEPWLRDRLAALVHDDATWSAVAAGGLLTRMAAIDARTDVIVDGVARPRRWAQAWTPADQRTVQDLAIGRVDEGLRLATRLETRLDEDPLADDVLDDVERLCLLRDDLQGVRALLWEAGDLGRLPAALAVLDRHGERIALNMPVLADPDTQLRKAARLERDAWWTLPVRG